VDMVQIHNDYCNGLLGTYQKVFKTNSLKQKFRKVISNYYTHFK
jgi:hypothetical protein